MQNSLSVLGLSSLSSQLTERITKFLSATLQAEQGEIFIFLFNYIFCRRCSGGMITSKNMPIVSISVVLETGNQFTISR